MFGGNSHSCYFSWVIKLGCRSMWVFWGACFSFFVVLQVVKIVGCVARLSPPFLGVIRLGVEEVWLLQTMCGGGRDDSTSHLHGPPPIVFSQKYYRLKGIEKIIMDRPSKRFLGNTYLILNVA